MILLKKGSLFRRAEVEMTEEEYKIYLLGSCFGRIEGFVFGVLLTMIIYIVIQIL